LDRTKLWNLKNENVAYLARAFLSDAKKQDQNLYGNLINVDKLSLAKPEVAEEWKAGLLRD
jgi:hypothetical protein